MKNQSLMENNSISKKVLILMSSPRLNCNTDKLCNKFKEGALMQGHSVVKIDIAKKNIKHCDSCYKCKEPPYECHINDDMFYVLNEFLSADVIVLASPVYFYSISAQLKTFIDRCVVKWENIADKEFYYIISAAQNSKLATVATIACMRGFVTCLKNSKERDILCACGINSSNPIENTDYLNQAFQMGTSI